MSDQPSDPSADQPQRPAEPATPSVEPPAEPATPSVEPPVGTTASLGEPPVGIGIEPLTPPPVAKPSVGRYAIIGVVVLALGAGAVFMANSKNDDGSLSAGSPTAAVENMLQVIGQGRIVDLMRGEFPWMGSVGDIDEQALAAAGLPGGRITGMSLAGEGLTFDVAEVGEELAVVTLTGGSLRYSVDFSKMPAAITAAMPQGMPDEIKDTVPIALLEAGICESYTESGRACPGLQVVTINDDGGWRVSLMHTMMHLSGAGTLEPRNPNGAISAADVEDRIETAMFENDINAFFDLLDPQEFAWVSDFRIDDDSSDSAPDVDLQFEVVEETAETAFLQLTGFEARSTEIVFSEMNPQSYTFEPSEREVVTTFDGDCIVEGNDAPTCLSDLASVDLGPFASAQPILDKLAQDGIRLGVVQRDGLWYLSVARTFEPFAPTIKAVAEEFGETLEQCKAVMGGLGGSGGSSAPLTAIPPQCQGLLGPLGMLGGFNGMSSGVATAESTFAPAPGYEPGY